MQNLMLLMQAIPDYEDSEDMDEDEFEELFKGNKR